MATVQLELSLFNDLIKWHLLGASDQDTADRIQRGLTDKLNALVKREIYTRSKTAGTPAEREEARRAYLDRIGVPEDFRW